MKVYVLQIAKVMTKGIVFVLLIMVLFGNLLGCTKELIEEDPEQEEKPEDEVIDPLVGEGYFVAPWGDDDDPGTFEKPWATWGKAFNASVVKPGDTVYFRGGVYYKDLSEGESNWYYPSRSSGGTGYNISRSGTGGYPVVYINYPDEKPILDCSRVEYPGGTKHAYGIRVTGIHNVRFTGLTLRNVFSAGPGTTNRGWYISGSDIVFKDCVIHNIHGQGFKSEEGKELYYINCDAHHCMDTTWTHPGEQGTGFSTADIVTRDGSVYFIGCRAWKCSDQGFTAGSISYVEWNGCWSFKNGALTAGGHGFKLGFVPRGTETLPVQRRVINCVAAYNRHTGFTTNDAGYPAQAMEIYNNIAYHNGYFPEYDDGNGFRIFPTTSSEQEELKRVYRNNIAYKNEGGDFMVYSGAPYTHSNNSWDSNVSTSDADFVSVDSTGILGPRQEDGSLPDLDFLKLVEDSDLIDAGVDVKIPFLGEAPDLGAYERK
jgi:hypothetical protein